MFSCTVCNKVLSCKETLKNHILSKHLRIRPFSCDICGKKFILKKSLLLHKNVHNKKKIKNCQDCGRIYTSLSSYKHHVKSYHQPSAAILKCSFCEKNFVDKNQLRYHVRANHIPKTIPCTFPSCKKVFSTLPLLRHHLKTHSFEKFECSVCLEKFKSKYYMEKHKLRHEGILPYKCSTCEKRYTTLSHLNFHWKRAHSTVNNFLCSFCGKYFKNKYDLIVHEKSHEDKMGDLSSENLLNEYESPLDGHKKKRLRKKNEIVEEEKRYLGDRKHLRSESERLKKNIPHYEEIPSESLPFKCLDCEKCFKTPIRVNEHWRRYHLVKTEFKCSLCRMSFQSNKDLHDHNFYHQDKHFKCDLCLFQTQHRIALHSHKKIHNKNLTQIESYPDKDFNKEEISSILENGNLDLKLRVNLNGEDTTPHKQRNSLNSIKKIKRKFNLKDEYLSQNTYAKHKVQEEKIRPENLKVKLKAKKSKYNYVPFTKIKSEFICPWEDECYELSEGLVVEQPLFSSLDLDDNIDITPKWNRSLESPQSSSSKLENNVKDFNGKYCFRNPKITLNCTAINDSLEENELFY